MVLIGTNDGVQSMHVTILWKNNRKLRADSGVSRYLLHNEKGAISVEWQVSPKGFFFQTQLSCGGFSSEKIALCLTWHALFLLDISNSLKFHGNSPLP